MRFDVILAESLFTLCLPHCLQGLIDAAEFKDLTLLVGVHVGTRCVIVATHVINGFFCAQVNNGKPMFPGTFAKAFSGLDDNADGSLDFEEFKKMNERFPMVLYPAFQFQDCCIKASLGADEWVKIRY